MRFVPFFLGTVSLLCIPIAAQTARTYPEYEKLLSEQLTRDQTFREQIAQEQALIIDYNVKIKESRERIEKLRQQKYSLLGATSVEVDQARSTLVNCSETVNSLISISDKRLLSEQGRIDSIRGALDAVSTLPAIGHPKLWKMLVSLKAQIDTIDQRVALLLEQDKAEPEEKPQLTKSAVASASYTVTKRLENPETLHSIAANVYGDASRWREIYRANQESLDRQFKTFNRTAKRTAIVTPSDLLLPGQVLVIPR